MCTVFLSLFPSSFPPPFLPFSFSSPSFSFSLMRSDFSTQAFPAVITMQMPPFMYATEGRNPLGGGTTSWEVTTGGRWVAGPSSQGRQKLLSTEPATTTTTSSILGGRKELGFWAPKLWSKPNTQAWLLGWVNWIVNSRGLKPGPKPHC